MAEPYRRRGFRKAPTDPGAVKVRTLTDSEPARRGVAERLGKQHFRCGDWQVKLRGADRLMT
jgi:hypothetical protein